MIYQRNASKNDPYQSDNVKYDSPVIVGILEERLVWSSKKQNLVGNEKHGENAVHQ